MALGSVNRNQGFWFGTEQRMDWFPTPNRGADMSPQDWNSEGTLLNGGAYNFASFGSHKTYTFEWPSTSAREVAQLMKSYADGTYGRGLIYFQDCLTFDTNVLPARVADPSMAIGYEGNSLVYGVQPKPVPALSGPNNLPVVAAQYDLSTSRVGFNKAAGAVFVPIPRGYTLAFGAVYSVASTSPTTSGVFLTRQDSMGNLGVTTRVDPLSGSGDLTNTYVTGSSLVTGVWVWLGRRSSFSSVVTVQAMTARLIRTQDMSQPVVATNYAPKIRGSGNWVEVRRNLHPNPDPWSSGSDYYYGAAAAEATLTRAGQALQWTLNTANLAGIRFAPLGGAVMGLVAGTRYRMKVRVRGSRAGMQVRAGFASGPTPAFQTVGTEWQWFYAEGEAGTNSDYYVGLYTTGNTVGDWIQVARVCIEKADPPDGSWFTGDGEGQGVAGTTTDPDFRARWLGTPHASQSVLEGQLAADMSSTYTVPVLSSAEGKPAIRVISQRNTDTLAYRSWFTIPPEARQNAVLAATRHLNSTPNVGESYSQTLSAGDPLRGTATPRQAGSVPLKVAWGGSSSGAPITATFRAYLYGDGPVREGSQDVYWTDIALYSGDYEGPWFDGDSVDPNGVYGYRWVGTPGESASQKYRISRELEKIRKGPWVGGQGHSGCRFSGKPTYIANSPVNGGQVQFAASFTEVGSWVNG